VTDAAVSFAVNVTVSLMMTAWVGAGLLP
jgi:hypothetical protein